MLKNLILNTGSAGILPALERFRAFAKVQIEINVETYKAF